MRPMISLAAAVLATSASAHVTVSPQQSAPGAREKYELRVPNERKSATITIEFRFPPGLRVTAIEQKPGWQAEAQAPSASALRFELSFTAAARAEPSDGRIFVMISKEKDPEPRLTARGYRATAHLRRRPCKKTCPRCRRRRTRSLEKVTPHRALGA